MLTRYFSIKFYFLLFLFLLPQYAFSATPKDCEKWIIEGIQAMNKKDYAKSLELLMKSREIAKENKFYREEFLAANNMGANYYMRFDYGEALNNYLDAYKIAVGHLDEKSEMTVLNNIAILYAKDKKNKKAEEYFLRAYHIADKVKNKSSKGLYAINLTIVSNEKKNYAMSEKYIGEALKLTEYSKFSLFAQATYVETLVNLKRYDEAKNISAELLLNLNEIENSEHKTHVLYSLATVEEEQNNLPKAFQYLALAEKSNVNYDFKENIFKKLSNLYKKANNIDRALAYKDSIIIVKDSLNRIKNGQLFENTRIHNRRNQKYKKKAQCTRTFDSKNINN